MNVYRGLHQWWAQTKAGISTEAIPEQRLAELERRYSISLPDDFGQYLRSSSPVGEIMDNELVTWWNFDRIRNIPDEYARELGPMITNSGREYLFFADYLDWCWAWAISCASDDTRGKVALIAGSTYDRFVADSFTGFVRQYVSDPKKSAIAV